MICYLDSSALVKLYILEFGSDEVMRAFSEADLVGTILVSRAEVVAAFSKAVRMGALTSESGEVARGAFSMEWRDLLRFDATEAVVERACDLAWGHGLKGYDSIQLAAALDWQDDLGFPVVFITFDVRLWKAAAGVGLRPFPHDLPGIQ